MELVILITLKIVCTVTVGGRAIKAVDFCIAVSAVKVSNQNWLNYVLITQTLPNDWLSANNQYNAKLTAHVSALRDCAGDCLYAESFKRLSS